jgi:hypothetical protein
MLFKFCSSFAFTFVRVNPYYCPLCFTGMFLTYSCKLNVTMMFKFKNNTDSGHVNINVRLRYNCSEIKFQAVCSEPARVQDLFCVQSVEILCFWWTAITIDGMQ